MVYPEASGVGGGSGTGVGAASRPLSPRSQLADQLTAAGSTTYSYDGNGNETSNSAGRQWSYNAKDQATSVTPPGGSAIPMSYTGTGQFKRVSAGSKSYTTSGLGLIREDGTSYVRDDSGKLLSMRTGTGSYYYLFDGLGSVAALTDNAGNVVATYNYEPFGKLSSTTGTIANPYRWLGGLGVYHDTSTGLYKMGTRYYDPSLGRFTQVDPIAGGSANAYDYARQDPINNVDPSGQICGPGDFGDAVTPDWIFGQACADHDICFGDYESFRNDCDAQFREDVHDACNSEYGGFDPRRYACHKVADLYYRATHSAAGAARFIQLKFGMCRRRGHSRAFCTALASYRAYR